MADFWTLPSNRILATIEERKTIRVNLPLNGRYIPVADTGIEVSIIAGTVPKGLRLDGYELVGTPFEVQRDTEYKFVVRAKLNNIVSDRTFSVIVVGADAPEWQTESDLLPVGNNNSFFIIDSAPLDFQLSAIDPDISAGDTLEYFLQAGELPPGIQLTTDGRLAGIVEPILALEKPAGSGHFDSNNYGSFPYDFGVRSGNGFDSFFYDSGTFDLSTNTLAPKKLNRFYEFTVRVSDGDDTSDRTFRIYVVGDDFLRADNTVMQVANGIFTADISNVRNPIWLTPSNFGFRRANNYVTLYLDVIDPNPDSGFIQYSLESLNDDGSASTLPPGMELDTQSGEIAGKVPYQPAITLEYKFTVRATRNEANTTERPFKDKTFTVKLLGEVDSVLTWNTSENLGLISSNYVSTLSISATSTVPNANLLYVLESGSLPPGLRLSYDGEIIGKINSFGTSSDLGLTVFDSQNLKLDGNTTTVDREYEFTASVRDHFGYSKITRTFTLTVGDPDDKLYSNISVRPLMKQTQRDNLNLIITDNNIFDADKIYRPNDPNFGLQKNLQMLVYSGIETKLIQEYVAATAKNHIRRNYKLGEVKTAVAKNPGSDDIIYEVVYVEVNDPGDTNTDKETRTKFNINNKQKIIANSVKYTVDGDSADNSDPDVLVIKTRRYGDVKYKLLPSLFVLSKAGLNLTVSTSDGFNIGTRDGLDETVLLDTGNFEPYRFRPVPENTIKVDSDALTIDGNEDRLRYKSNITNMRKNIRAIGETEINYLPLWMRTAQPGSINILGYVPAIPICYTKPGQSESIRLAIANAGIKFNQFDYDIDRYVIDSTEGVSQEQYIKFGNYKFNA